LTISQINVALHANIFVSRVAAPEAPGLRDAGPAFGFVKPADRLWKPQPVGVEGKEGLMALSQDTACGSLAKAEGIVVTPLTSSIGARVSGVNLREDISPDVAILIRRAFQRYGVLVFSHRYAVGSEEAERLASLFGEPQPIAPFQFLGALSPELTLTKESRIGDDLAEASAPIAFVNSAEEDSIARELQSLGVGADRWHTDSSFTSWLPRVGVVRGEIIPPVGGDTGFTSLCAAYEALSPVMRRIVTELTAVHMVPPGYKENLSVRRYGEDAELRFDAEFPPREWPVVIEHPESGRRSLFVNPGYTVYLRGMKRDESSAVLRFLFDHIAGGNFHYRHHWATGDLVLWDEVTVLHRAPDDYAPYDRKVVRVTAGRCVPKAPEGSVSA
jgi:taurine dioxygenase